VHRGGGVRGSQREVKNDTFVQDVVHVSYGESVVGEGCGARLAGKGCCECRNQSRIDWVQEGGDMGIIKRKKKRWTEISIGQKEQTAQRCAQPKDDEENGVHCCRFLTFCESH